jgi:hypothetical protein
MMRLGGRSSFGNGLVSPNVEPSITAGHIFDCTYILDIPNLLFCLLFISVLKMAGSKVLVLGATGPAGINVLRELSHRKRSTIAYARNPSKIPEDLISNKYIEVRWFDWVHFWDG